jgi:hypothetical protein
MMEIPRSAEAWAAQQFGGIALSDCRLSKEL